jgi:hypothetical protein
MVTEIYVIGSIILSMIVVGLFFFGSKDPSWIDGINAAFQCPRCGAMMEESGRGISGGELFIFLYPHHWCVHVHNVDIPNGRGAVEARENNGTLYALTILQREIGRTSCASPFYNAHVA